MHTADLDCADAFGRPLRLLALADRPGGRRRRRAAAGVAEAGRRRRRLVGRGAARRGRAGGADAHAIHRRRRTTRGRAGRGDARRGPTCAPGSTSTAAAPGRWSPTTSSSSSTSPTSGSTASGWARSRSRSRPEPEQPRRPALRRHAAHPGRAHGRLRARGPRRGRSREPDRRPRARRLRRAGGARLAGATSTPSRGSAPTAAWLAWTCWDHPNMPWDGTELWVAPLRRHGRRAPGRRRPEESVFQPEWDAAGRLHFVSDRDGWWNLYRDEGGQVVAAHRARRPSSATRSGCSAARPTPSSPTAPSPSSAASAARNGSSCSTPAPSARATSASPTPRSASPRCRHGGRRSPSPPPARPARPPIVVFDLASGELEVVRERQRGADRPRLRLDPAGDRVPDQRRRDRVRLLLPAGQPRLRGARRASCRR